MTRSHYLGDYYATECHSLNPYLENPTEYFFEPIATLFLAIAIVSLHMWLRRGWNIIQLVIEAKLFKISRIVELHVRAAAKLPVPNQTLLAASLQALGADAGMPDLPSFTDLAMRFAELSDAKQKLNKPSSEGSFDGSISFDSLFSRGKKVSLRRVTAPDRSQEAAKAAEAVRVETWLTWFSTHQKQNPEFFHDFVEVIQEAKGKAQDMFNRDLLRIIFFLQNIVAASAALDYIASSRWPQGNFYFCQLPYLLSIVTFKPFAVPMYFTLTVLAHHSFVEEMFGHSPAHRDCTRRLVHSPLPRDPISLYSMYFVVASYMVWFFFMVVGSGPTIVVFAPVLLIPGFVLPMVVMYAPCVLLDAVADTVRRRLDTPVRQVHLKFDETVLILKSATTQVISLAMLGVPLLPFLAGRLGWAQGAKALLDLTLSFDWPTLKLLFKLTFAWPSLRVPHLSILLGFSVGLLAFQYFMQATKSLLDFLDFLCPLLGNPTLTEQRSLRLFATFTWERFRAASDLLRTAVESSVAARNDFRKIVYNDFTTYFLGPVFGRVVEQVPSTVLAATAGPFLIAYSYPFSKMFGSAATDDDLVAFVSDQGCLAYHRVICRNNNNVTSKALTSVLSCAWLEVLSLTGCTGVQASAETFARLTRVKKLSITDCAGIHGTTAHLASLRRLRELVIDNCAGITGSLADLSGLVRLNFLFMTNCVGITGSTRNLVTLAELRVLRISNCVGIVGAVSDLSQLTQLTRLVMDGCSSVRGTTADFSPLARLQWLDISGCTNISGSTLDLAKLKHLETLFLKDCPGIQGSPADFRRMRSLETSGSGVSDEESSSLAVELAHAKDTRPLVGEDPALPAPPPPSRWVAQAQEGETLPVGSSDQVVVRAWYGDPSFPWDPSKGSDVAVGVRGVLWRNGDLVATDQVLGCTPPPGSERKVLLVEFEQSPLPPQELGTRL